MYLFTSNVKLKVVSCPMSWPDESMGVIWEFPKIGDPNIVP